MNEVTGTAAMDQSIRRLFTAIDQKLWSRLPGFFTADAVYERPGYPPLRGLPDILYFYQQVRIVAEGRHEIEYAVMQGDVAACWGRFTGVSRDGRQLAERFADTYVLRNGRIAARTTYFFRRAI